MVGLMQWQHIWFEWIIIRNVPLISFGSRKQSFVSESYANLSHIGAKFRQNIWINLKMHNLQSNDIPAAQMSHISLSSMRNTWKKERRRKAPILVRELEYLRWKKVALAFHGRIRSATDGKKAKKKQGLPRTKSDMRAWNGKGNLLKQQHWRHARRMCQWYNKIIGKKLSGKFMSIESRVEKFANQVE